MINLICQKCNHSWVYKGKSDYYTSCPRCKTSVKVKKPSEGESTSQKTQI